MPVEFAVAPGGQLLGGRLGQRVFAGAVRERIALAGDQGGRRKPGGEDLDQLERVGLVGALPVEDNQGGVPELVGHGLDARVELRRSAGVQQPHRDQLAAVQLPRAGLLGDLVLLAGAQIAEQETLAAVNPLDLVQRALDGGPGGGQQALVVG